MNAERRKQIEALAAKAADLANEISMLKADVDTVRDEEQEYYDNMPESFQNGDKGEKAQAAISALEEAVSALEDACGGFDELESLFSTAAE